MHFAFSSRKKGRVKVHPDNTGTIIFRNTWSQKGKILKKNYKATADAACATCANKIGTFRKFHGVLS